MLLAASGACGGGESDEGDASSALDAAGATDADAASSVDDGGVDGTMTDASTMLDGAIDDGAIDPTQDAAPPVCDQFMGAGTQTLAALCTAMCSYLQTCIVDGGTIPNCTSSCETTYGSLSAAERGAMFTCVDPPVTTPGQCTNIDACLDDSIECAE
jgi:hypothetical protein